MSLKWPGCSVQVSIYVFKNTQGQTYKHILELMRVCLKQERERWRKVGLSGQETYPAAPSLRRDGEWNPIVPVIKLIFPDYSTQSVSSVDEHKTPICCCAGAALIVRNKNPTRSSRYSTHFCFIGAGHIIRISSKSWFISLIPFKKWNLYNVYIHSTQTDIFQVFIYFNFDDYNWQLMKTPNSVSQKIRILWKGSILKTPGATL